MINSTSSDYFMLTTREVRSLVTGQYISAPEFLLTFSKLELLHRELFSQSS